MKCTAVKGIAFHCRAVAADACSSNRSSYMGCHLCPGHQPKAADDDLLDPPACICGAPHPLGFCSTCHAYHPDQVRLNRSKATLPSGCLDYLQAAAFLRSELCPHMSDLWSKQPHVSNMLQPGRLPTAHWASAVHAQPSGICLCAGLCTHAIPAPHASLELVKYLHCSQLPSEIYQSPRLLLRCCLRS